jgi:hypothetical protein
MFAYLHGIDGAATMIYKNKKSGKFYIYLGRGIDCTNDRDGIEVVIYTPTQEQITSRFPLCVRYAREFEEKFVPVEEHDIVIEPTQLELPLSGD